MATEIGKRILERRKELGLTQEDLALKMGYKSKSTINKIELGINDVSQSKVVKFAEVLHTTPAFLMGWAEVQKKNDTLTDAVIRMQTDDVFMAAVEKLYNLDQKKLLSILALLD